MLLFACICRPRILNCKKRKTGQNAKDSWLHGKDIRRNSTWTVKLLGTLTPQVIPDLPLPKRTLVTVI